MSAKEIRRRSHVPTGKGGTVHNAHEENPKPRNRGTGPKRFSKSVTRERLQGQFHLPMEEAGRMFGVSTTIVKRVCRTFGIERWPYRQIQSARKRIDLLKEKLRSGARSAAEQEKIEGDIRTLTAKIHDLLINPNPPPKCPKAAFESHLPSPTINTPKVTADFAVAAVGVCEGNRTGGEGNSWSSLKLGNIDFMGYIVNVPIVKSEPKALRSAPRKIDQKSGSRAGARAIGASVAATTAAVASSKQGDKRFAAISKSIPIAATTPMAVAGEATAESFRKPKRVKVEKGVQSKIIYRGDPCATTRSPRVSSYGRKIFSPCGYGDIHEKYKKSTPRNSFMQAPLFTAQPAAFASEVLRRWNGLEQKHFVRKSAGEYTHSPTLAGISSRGSNIGYSRSTQDLASCTSATLGRNMGRAESCPSEVEHSCREPPISWKGTDQVGAKIAGPAGPAGFRQQCRDFPQKEGSGFARAGFRVNSFSSDTTGEFSAASTSEEAAPLPMSELCCPVWRDSWEGGGVGRNTNVEEKEEVVLALDEFGLNSALMLDIPEGCPLGGGSSSSSWMPLSGGSYPNTDEAFAAFSFIPRDIVPEGW